MHGYGSFNKRHLLQSSNERALDEDKQKHSCGGKNYFSKPGILLIETELADVTRTDRTRRTDTRQKEKQTI